MADPACGGAVFFTQRILKFMDPRMGVERFARVGFPHPNVRAHFTFDIVCGRSGIVFFCGARRAIRVDPMVVLRYEEWPHAQASDHHSWEQTRIEVWNLQTFWTVDGQPFRNLVREGLPTIRPERAEFPPPPAEAKRVSAAVSGERSFVLQGQFLQAYNPSYSWP